MHISRLRKVRLFENWTAYVTLRFAAGGERRIVVMLGRLDRIFCSMCIYTFWAIYMIKVPGSTCKIVFIRSRNTLARFSSPFFALTLKTLTPVSLPVPEIGSDAGPRGFRDGALEEGRAGVSSSMMSTCFARPAGAIDAIEFAGRATI